MGNRLEEQLFELNHKIIEMGALCETIIEKTMTAFSTSNTEVADIIRQESMEIDRMEREIETQCMKLLLHYQPVACDLRLISAAMKMITDMERIGDQAEEIAEILMFLNEYQGEYLVEEMAQETIEMVTKSIDAFIKKDVFLAEKVIIQDDVVDDCFCRIKRDIIKRITINTADGESALDLLMIAKYLERIGDHAVNIAEWVIYAVTGKHKGCNNDMVCRR